ncbi:hypothetical protein [Haladaptatus sp. CMAA 1911]|uniref:hypothetical protein n=1 Tax=unclassified Haladaptatus TaxID=2622732 RepID=UPI0037551CC8
MHTSETFSTLATTPGERELQLGDGSSCRVKAGTVDVNQNFDSVSLDNFFGSETPIVLAQAQTFDGSDPIVTRVRNVSNVSFDVRVQEEEAAESHVPETVGYIALEQATGTLYGTPFEVRQTDTTVNENWTRLTFDHKYTQPQFISSMQTFNGPDTANLRYRNLTSTGVEVKVEEEQSTDTETSHTNERIGYAVFADSV